MNELTKMRGKYVIAGIGHTANKLSKDVTYAEPIKVLSTDALHAAR